ncbi:armadillo-type protein [Lophiotrema nucula]|uniref:Armadillo-type protein n=1 Tax=Lophiotrema nucula TaxID=690887 RepID=A0A6A5YKD5_9PLEO|nr:armadillo-type protein [Lophiotrema nucula]
MDRQQAFKRLKKPCVEILEAVASLQQRPSAKKQLVEALAQLLKTLIESNAEALDAKFAEFVFVPISRVLAVSGSVPVRALELCLDCVSILLKTGWKADLTPQLSGQLLILFTFLANPSSAENGIPVTSDELQAGALTCMGVLFDALASTAQGKRSLTSTPNIPTLGKAVLVIVDNIADSTASEVRLQAVGTLQKLVTAVDDADALASFFPRMVSSLTKALTPSTTIRVKYRVLVLGMDTLSILLTRVLSDAQTKDLPASTSTDAPQHEDKVLRTTSWLDATTSQIKIALANILKLRNHDKKEVQEALLRLCLAIMQDCRKSLRQCVSMTIETLVHLAGRDRDRNTIEQELKFLLSSDLQLSSILRESLHGWVVSVPRLMQSKDDSARRQVIHSIAVTLRLLGENNADLGDIDYLLAGNLRDGVLNVINDSQALQSLVAPTTTGTIESNMDVTTMHSLTFQPIKLRLKGQDDMMKEFGFLLHEVASSSSSTQVAEDLVTFVKSGSPEVRFASFWLAVNLVRDTSNRDDAVDAFLDLRTSSIGSDTLDELYSFSLDELSNLHNEDSSHWQVQALGLETVALQAQKYGTDFRVELNEALYPVLHLLGSSTPALRHHAITCLNIMAVSCGYHDASDLVVSNVDYIVNAVGMQLNSHNISPQAPQVLLMMMRLCGPSLLPFLDDLVGSIFSALETYHGYPKLVELLFAALKGMAEEGVKAPQLALTEREESSQTSAPSSLTDLDSVTRLLRILQEKSPEQAEKLGENDKEAFPKGSWKEEQARKVAGKEDDVSGDVEGSPQEPPESPPPAPRTFDILLKISELTQHYLTSASPSLRTSLLSILHTTIPALAKHENSFLPLINTLWPVLLPRLEDSEAYVVSNALDIVAVMCEYAGNFMKSRIECIWEDIKSIYQRTLKQADEMRGNHQTKSANLNIIRTGHEISKPSSGSELAHSYLYVDAPSRMIWESLVAFLCKVAKHVVVRDEFYDDTLDMVDPVLGRAEVRKALESRNPDAIWLREYRKSNLQAAQLDDETVRPASTNVPTLSVPVSEALWNFVPL